MKASKPRPTSAGWGVTVVSTVLVAGGVMADYPELVVLSLSGLSALVLAVVWTAVRPNIRADRRLVSTRVQEGASAECVLTVLNAGNRASRPMEITESLLPAPIPLPRIDSGERVTVGPYGLPLARRGIYQIPPPFVGRSDPFRLLRGGVSCGSATTVHVHPRVYPMAVPGFDRSEEATAARGALRSALSFHNLREYRGGDDCRLIHWMSTARVGDLVVRQHVPPEQPAHLVVLDTSEPRYTVESFEEAVRLAASVCVAVASRGLRVELLTDGGHRVPGSTRGGGGAADAILDHLAVVGPTPDQRDLGTWLGAAAAARQETILTVVTGRFAPEQAGALSAEARRWARMTVVALDPQAAGMVTVRGNLRIARVGTCAELVTRMGWRR